MFCSQALLRPRLSSQLLRMGLQWRTATPELRYVSSLPPNNGAATLQGLQGGVDGAKPPGVTSGLSEKVSKQKVNHSPGGCEDDDKVDDDNDDMEQEEMFVEAHESFEHGMLEWGGPRRGGRLPEPTRFGDWERKGRCTDF